MTSCMFRSVSISASASELEEAEGKLGFELGTRNSEFGIEVESEGEGGGVDLSWQLVEEG